MSWRPHPRRATSDNHRGPWATCDGCGFIHHLPDLIWQLEYAGFTMVNKRLLKCDICNDIPNEQLRSIVLPPDPDPVINARPEQYAIDEGLVAAFTASIRPAVASDQRPGQPNVIAVMIVTNIGSGIISTGANLNGTNVATSSVVGDQLTGANPPGGIGNYAVTPVQTVASTNMTTIGN